MYKNILNNEELTPNASVHNSERGMNHDLKYDILKVGKKQHIDNDKQKTTKTKRKKTEKKNREKNKQTTHHPNKKQNPSFSKNPLSPQTKTKQYFSPNKDKQQHTNPSGSELVSLKKSGGYGFFD